MNYTLTSESSRTAAVRAILALPIEKLSPPAEVVIREKRTPKTHQQLRTVHMWFNEIAAAQGDEPERVKARLKDEYGLMWGSFTKQVRLSKDEVIPVEVNIPKSLADYSLSQMCEFMTKVQMYASENGLTITQPQGDNW